MPNLESIRNSIIKPPVLMPKDTLVNNLGPCRIPSPLAPHMGEEAQKALFIRESQALLHKVIVDRSEPASPDMQEQPFFELAGPRAKIFFDPSKTNAGIVTCGGLCPGINEVIRSLVRHLHFIYGVRHVAGFKYGYQGFIARYGHDVVDLTTDFVDGIQDNGGTVLGSSRGEQDVVEIVDCLENMRINMLFVIGGDGTLRGAQAIVDEVARRDARIAVIGIPKTIDNDILYVDESFGFQTACSVAVSSLLAAHAESKGGPNGIGLVKLMGRHSGFIACQAALAMSDVNFVLIPELPFKLEGEHGFLNSLHDRLLRRRHAVIVVAEGAGQEYIKSESEKKDASGNVVLKDIGVYLRDRIADHFRSIGMAITLKYIDPSYTIRSVPASSQDNVYCINLAHHAVHAALAGKTGIIISRWHNHFVHVPMALATSGRKQVNPLSDLWLSVIESTGQPGVFY